MITVARALITAGAVLSFGLAGPVLASDNQSGAQVAQATNPCSAKNPCAAKNACAANPCAAKNPCGAAGKVDPKLITRPAGTKLMAGKPADLIKEGERLWNDKKLSSNGLACQTCHQGNAAFLPSFAKPYPHPVAMVKEKAGLKQVQLDEMVQICMVVPMASKPLPWASRINSVSAWSSC